MSKDLYQLQIVSVDEGERPEYENEPNKKWETILESDTAEGLLCAISDMLNDEWYPTSDWTRVVKNGVVLQTDLKVAEEE